MDPRFKLFAQRAAWLYEVPAQPMSKQEYLALALRAVRLADAIPEQQADIAYQMMNIGEWAPEDAQTLQLRGLFKELAGLHAASVTKSERNKRKIWAALQQLIESGRNSV